VIRLWIILIILSICLLLFNCTPTKRISKILYNNPDLIQTRDTTIYIKSSSIDTTFILNRKTNKDTFYINEIKTQIIRHYDTLKIETESKRDSIIIKTNTIKLIPRTQKEIQNYNYFKRIVIILCFLVVLMGLYVIRNLIK